MSLQGKVAIVTGGATGIGAGITRALAAQQVQVAVVQPELVQAESFAKTVQGAAGFAADIRDFDAVQQMTQDVVARFGRLDFLVNNAAITGPAALAQFVSASQEHVQEILDVNVKGTIWCSQCAARHWIAEKKPGVIVHIASVGSFAAQELASVYCASKAAQSSLAQSMALELATHGIRVNAVAPGDILTERSADVVSDIKSMGSGGRYLRQTPLGRRGSPEDIGNAVVFLLSDQAAFITGETLRVDGGFLSY